VLQTFLTSARGVEALDRLTAIAVNRTRPRPVRLAAIRAIRDLGPSTIAPLLTALGSDPDQAIALAAGLGPDAAADPVYLIRDAVEATLPDSPAALRLALTEAGEHLPLPLLQQLVERARFREGAVSGPIRAEWVALRGTAHKALADRGSRLALYDLKESFESAREALPVDFLGAAAAIGDAACLESVRGSVQPRNGHRHQGGTTGGASVWWTFFGRLPRASRSPGGRPPASGSPPAGRRPPPSSGLDGARPPA
jgi:hypothetical protein